MACRQWRTRIPSGSPLRPGQLWGQPVRPARDAPKVTRIAIYLIADGRKAMQSPLARRLRTIRQKAEALIDPRDVNEVLVAM